jgi:hypothetical protein
LNGKLPLPHLVEEKESTAARSPYDHTFSRIARFIHTQDWKMLALKHIF